jgi:hypothetical protein
MVLTDVERQAAEIRAAADAAAIERLAEAATLAQEVLDAAATAAAFLAQGTTTTTTTATTTPAVFSLGPGTVASANGTVMDYSKRGDASNYHHATLGQVPKYDGDDENLEGFLEAGREHAARHGWSAVSTINLNKNTSGIPELVDIFTCHGKVVVEDVLDDAATRLGTHSLNAQLSQQMYIYLNNSLARPFAAEIALRKNMYTVDGKPDGPAYLMTIIEKVTRDLITSSHALRVRLRAPSLQAFLASCNYNVRLFGNEILTIIQGLERRNQTYSDKDLLLAIFEVLMRVKHPDFHTEVVLETNTERTQNARRSGLPEYTALDAVANLTTSFEKYETTFPAVLREVEVVSALQAQLTAVQGQVVALSTKLDGVNTDAKKKEKWAPAPWKSVAPTASEPWKKTVKNVEWLWCDFHKKWAKHESTSCEARPRGPPDVPPVPPPPDTTPGAASRASAAASAAAASARAAAMSVLADYYELQDDE